MLACLLFNQIVAPSPMYQKAFQEFLHALAASYPTTDIYFLPHDEFLLQDPPDEQMALEQLDYNSEEWDDALIDFVNSNDFYFANELTTNDVEAFDNYLFGDASDLLTQTRANATQRFTHHVPAWVNIDVPADHPGRRGAGALTTGGQPAIDGKQTYIDNHAIA